MEDQLGHRLSIYTLKPSEPDSELGKAREQVKRITQRLYTLKPNPAYIAEHRATRSQVLNLRQVTRNSKGRAPHPSLSTIHNLSMDMVAAIKGARVRRTSEDQPMPRSVQSSLGPTGTQLRYLTSQMQQVLSLSHTLLPSDLHAKHPGRSYLGAAHPPVLRFPRPAATRVKVQLQSDVKWLSQKLRLVVSSLLLLEEDLKECGEAVQEKRKILQKRANSLYVLLEFLRKVKERAVDFVKRIDAALSTAALVEEGKHADLAADILAMSQGRAIEFITEMVEVSPPLCLAKKELLKYERVGFAKVLPRLIGCSRKQSV